MRSNEKKKSIENKASRLWRNYDADYSGYIFWSNYEGLIRDAKHKNTKSDNIESKPVVQTIEAPVNIQNKPVASVQKNPPKGMNSEVQGAVVAFVIIVLVAVTIGKIGGTSESWKACWVSIAIGGGVSLLSAWGNMNN